MPPNCKFAERFGHYSFGIIASGLVLIGYELQMSLLGQIVPIRLHNRILGCNTLQPSVLEDDGDTVFDVELKITQ